MPALVYSFLDYEYWLFSPRTISQKKRWKKYGTSTFLAKEYPHPTQLTIEGRTLANLKTWKARDLWHLVGF